MCAIKMAEKRYTIQEVADTLRVHRNTVQSWITSKKLVANQFGGIYRIAQSDLDDFVQRTRTVQPEPDAKEEE